MDEDSLYQLILRALADRQTALNGSVGLDAPTILVDTPWGPIEVVNDIGGLGELDANTYPYEDWADTGVANEWGTTSATAGSDVIGGYPVDNVVTTMPIRSPAAEALATAAATDYLGQLQYGLAQHQQNPNMVPGGAYPQYTLGAGPQLTQLAIGMDQRTRGEYFPDPTGSPWGRTIPAPISAEPRLGVGLDKVLQAAVLRGNKSIPTLPYRAPVDPQERNRPAATPGRGLDKVMQAAPVRADTAWRQLPAAQAATRNTTPRSTTGQSLRSSVPGVAALRTRSR